MTHGHSGISPNDFVVANSPVMRKVLDEVSRAAEQPCGVLLCGERGSGRGLLAREVHRRWAGPAAPFRPVDCAEDCVEHVEQILASHAGDTAGTLFLADLDILPAQAQWRLARLFDEQPTALRPMASAGVRAVDVRSQAIRLDLWQRVATVRIEVPPLRRRSEDIAPLAATFMDAATRASGLEPKVLDASSVALLMALPWHGNAAELRRLVEYLAVHVPGTQVSVQDVLSAIQLEGAVRDFATALTLRDATRCFQRDFISSALSLHGGRITETARALGVQRPNLYRKMRSLGIRPKGAKAD